MVEEVCVCRHSIKRHMKYHDFCYACSKDSRHAFKLDNLKLVEDLAKERNLI